MQSLYCSYSFEQHTAFLISSEEVNANDLENVLAVCHPVGDLYFGFYPSLQQLSVSPPLQELAPKLCAGCCQLKFHAETSPRISYQTDIEHLGMLPPSGKSDPPPSYLGISLRKQCYRLPLCPRCLCGNSGSSRSVCNPHYKSFYGSDSLPPA